MSPRRLSRAESKADTRRRLLASAERVFARRGYHAASVEEVAEEAGFSKGAVYSNFDGKDELFLAMIDVRFERRLEEIRAAVAMPEPPGAQARRSGQSFVAALDADPHWPALLLEFWAHVQRNPPLRRRFAGRVRALRREVAAIIAARARELEVELPLDPEQIAAMTFAMASGIAVERALDPEAVPEGLFATMLEMFFAGLGAAAEPRPLRPTGPDGRPEPARRPARRSTPPGAPAESSSGGRARRPR